MTSADLVAAASGLGLGLSLIVAIGAQNAFVLRQGLRREHVAPVVAVCAASDALLIAAGVAGAGALLQRRRPPGAARNARILGRVGRSRSRVRSRPAAISLPRRWPGSRSVARRRPAAPPGVSRWL